MRFLITLLFAFIATAAAFPQFSFLEARKDKNATEHANKNSTSKGENSVKKACHKMDKMLELTKLAANQTKLDALVAKGKLNETEVQHIKDKAANATSMLQTMQANTTLVNECNIFNAAKKTKAECSSIKKLTKMAALMNNQTAMDALIAKKKLNDTQVTKFKEQITNAETKLKELQSNTTLTDLCSKQESQKGSTSSGTTNSQSSPEQSTGAASALTVQTLPYVFVPALAAVFTFLL